jgi:hypothetical protein
MRHRKNNRRFRYRSNGRPNQSRINGSEPVRTLTNSFSNGRNKNNFKSYVNPEKLVEKYNTLAKEALSSGDRILSENYFQHADHFKRIVEEKTSYQNQNRLQVNSESKTEKQIPAKDNNIKQENSVEEKK